MTWIRDINAAAADTDLDQIYEKFGVDYNLLVLLMRREVDKEGKFQIRWGEQMIA